MSDHPSSRLLERFGRDQLNLNAADVHQIDAHLAGCTRCQRRLAAHVPHSDLDDAWAAIVSETGAAHTDESSNITLVQRLHRQETHQVVSFPDEHTTPPVPARTRPVLRIAAVAAAVILLTLATWPSRSGSPDTASTVESAGQGWTTIHEFDSEALGLDSGPSPAIAISWQGDLAVVIEPADGPWIVLSVDEDGTSRTTQTSPPEGCTLNWGHAVIADGLVVACSSPDQDGLVAVTDDLVHWESHRVPGRPDFGALVGSAPGGGVAVAVVEADDPNTTVGSMVRVSTSTDLEKWTEVEGLTPNAMVDLVPERMVAFEDALVLVGATSEYTSAGVIQRPAVWTSRGGAPFIRTLLPDPPGEGPTPGFAFDASPVPGGLVVVGGAPDCCRPLAWSSPDGVTWSPSLVYETPVLDRPPTGTMWSVTAAPDGTVLTGGVSVGSSTQVWSSPDDGRSWTPTGDGPQQVVVVGSTVFGLSTDPVTVFRWDGLDDTSAIATDPSRTPQQTVLSPEAIIPADSRRIIPVPPQPDRPGFFLLRNSNAELVALAMSDPRNSCRLALSDVQPGAHDPEATFSDPCHGSTYARDGTKTGGPSPRGLGSYRLEIRTDRVIIDTTLLQPGRPVDATAVATPDLEGLGRTDDTALAILTSFRDAARDLELQGDQIVALGAFHDESTNQVVVPFLWGASAGRLTVGVASDDLTDDRPADPPSFEVIEDNTPTGDGFLHTTIVLRSSSGQEFSLKIRTTGPIDIGTLESLLRAAQ